MRCAILCKPGWHAIILNMLQEPQIYCTGDTDMEGHTGTCRVCGDRTKWRV